MNVEMELESSAIGNPQALHDHVKKLFLLAKSAVDEELGIKESAPARLPANTNNGNSSSAATNGTTAGAPTTGRQCDRIVPDEPGQLRDEHCLLFKGTSPRWRSTLRLTSNLLQL